MKNALVLSSLLLLNACAMLPADQGNVYELRRQAESAYLGNEDERAEKLLLGVLRAAPNDAESWLYLGNLYARTNRPNEAVDAYQKALMLNRGDARAWHNLGVVRLRQAWASFISAYDTSKPDDPLLARSESIIQAMERIPLEGLKRNRPAGEEKK